MPSRTARCFASTLARFSQSHVRRCLRQESLAATPRCNVSGNLPFDMRPFVGRLLNTVRHEEVMRALKRSALGFAVSVAVVFGTANEGRAADMIRVGVLKITVTAPLWLADENGWFAA